MSTAVQILEGEGVHILERREKALKELAGEIKAGGFKAFPLVVAGERLNQTIATVIQASGIGPLRANTAVANWIEGMPWTLSTSGARIFSQNLRMAFALGCNLLVVHSNRRAWEELLKVRARDRTIDVIWSISKSGELMLLLAHILAQAGGWRGAKLRVLVQLENDEGEAHAIDRLKGELEEFRIDAEVVAYGNEDLAAKSVGGSLVFLPFSIHGERFYGPLGHEVSEYLKALPIVVLVMAAQEDDLAADPDQVDPPPDQTESVEEKSQGAKGP